MLSLRLYCNTAGFFSACYWKPSDEMTHVLINYIRLYLIMIYTFRQKWWNTIIKRNNSVRETGEQLRLFYCVQIKWLRFSWMIPESIRMSSLNAELIWCIRPWWSEVVSQRVHLAAGYSGKNGWLSDNLPGHISWLQGTSWVQLSRPNQLTAAVQRHASWLHLSGPHQLGWNISWSQVSWPCPAGAYIEASSRGISADCTCARHISWLQKWQWVRGP